MNNCQAQCILPCPWPKGTQRCLQANYRKGGLLCLAASAVGLADHGQEFLQRIVPPVLNSFTDQDSRVRYYACEVCGSPHLHSCALESVHLYPSAALPALPPAAGAPALVICKGTGPGNADPGTLQMVPPVRGCRT